MVWDQDGFNDYVISHDVVSFSEVEKKLKSGRFANWYINWRLEDAFTLNEVSDLLIDFVKSKDLIPDTFYGVPEGMTRLGIITQYKWAQFNNWFPGSHVIAMGRGKHKEHGDPRDKYFVGAPRGKVLLLEDVTTTGGSSIETLDFLIESGYEVIGLIALSNRNEVRDDGFTVPELMTNKGVLYYALSEAIKILPLAAKKQCPPIEWLMKTQAYTKKYCSQEIFFSL